MTTQDTLQSLAEIGLSKYESKVYLTLVSEGISTAKTLSDITGIPYGKVYEIINSLSYKGLTMILPSKPMKYRAISPYQTFLWTKKNAQEKFEKLERKLIQQLAFQENRKFAGSKSTVLIFNGRSHVVKKVEELIQKARRNIHIQCSANTLSRLTLHKDSLQAAAGRNVKILIAGVSDKKNMKEIKSLDFCSLKHIANSHNNFISVDGKSCLITEAIPDDDNIIYGRDLGISVLSPSFTKFVDNFFVSNFKRAKEVRF